MHRDRLAAIHGEAGEATDDPGRIRPGTISPPRPVPAHIPRPEYASNSRPHGKSAGTLIKSAEQIERMRVAGRAAYDTLNHVLSAIAPGVTTDELDRIAHERCIELGGYPSPLNYCGFPKSICTSINEVICHGIPDDRRLADGDIVNCDITIYLDGVHGDCSQTVAVGTTDSDSARLIDVTRQALYAGIAAVQPGGRISDIGRAIEDCVHPHGYGVVRDFVGHGIGEVFHMEPQVPHYFDQRNSFVLRPGMTFTIEPMINGGDWRHRVWRDNWTAVTIDGRRSAQFEHTVLVREDGTEILTLAADESQPFCSG